MHYVYRGAALYGIVLSSAVWSAATPACAVDMFWSVLVGDGSGIFSNAANWTESAPFSSPPPDSNDVAHFGMTSAASRVPATYTVSFTTSPTNRQVIVEDDRVTFDLNAHTYALTSDQTSTAITLGTLAGRSGRLTVLEGVISLPVDADLVIGEVDGGSGELTVGAGGLVIGLPDVLVGRDGDGGLTINNNGDVAADDAFLAVNGGSIGTATITGGGSSLLADLLTVGVRGSATLSITAAGRVDSANGLVAEHIGSSGNVLVDGPNCRWNVSGILTIGRLGSGALSITGGATVQSQTSIIGMRLANDGGTGAVTVAGEGSQWISSGHLDIGFGEGTLTISDGGLVQCASATLGNASSGASSGTVSVSGAASRWISGGEINIGIGTLRITGGQVQNTNANVGGVQGTVIVTGPTSQWINLGKLTIGAVGVGTLDIVNGRIVESESGLIGRESNGTGRVTVDGANGDARWINTGGVVVGLFSDNAVLEVKNGGLVQSTTGDIGALLTGNAVVTVDGANSEGSPSQWVMSGRLRVGGAAGTLNIVNGARVESVGGALGKLVSIVGPGSRWVNLGDLAGDIGRNELNITAGGRLECVNGALNGLANISGPDSQWVNLGELDIGPSTVPSTLNISGGGLVRNTAATIGRDSSSTPHRVNIADARSRWINSGTLKVGMIGDAILNISEGGRVQSASGFVGVGLPSAAGSVNLAGRGTNWTVNGDLTLHSGRATINAGGNLVVAQQTILNTSGTAHLNGGVFSTSAISFTSPTGEFLWTSGTLHVGQYGGDIVVPNGGVLAPGNSAGQTQIHGALTALPGGTIQIEIGGASPTEFDRILVDADVTFGGNNLQLSLLNDFRPDGRTFVILDSVLPISGSFANVLSGQRLTVSEGRGSFVVTYGFGAPDPTQVVLSAFQPRTNGDFDHDGDVDGNDFLVWQRGGSPNPNSAGDLGDWSGSFGQPATTASGIAVPEPSWLGAALAPIALLVKRRRPSIGAMNGHATWLDW